MGVEKSFDVTTNSSSCIVIHDLGGHAFGSFRSVSPDSTYMWLRDSLPKHFAQLRVWIYGYDSNLRDTESIADLYEFAATFRRDLCILRGKTKVGYVLLCP